MFLYKLFLCLASRPVFFRFWLLIRKLSAHALNMSSAARLPCKETGEQIALSYVLSKCRQKDKVVIFDVGANRGDYTNMCLNALKTTTNRFDIYSFEPIAASVESLRQRFSSDSQIHIYGCGLGNKLGEQILYIPDSTTNIAGPHKEIVDLCPQKFTEELKEEKIVVETLDNLIGKHSLHSIQLLKIDVEGTEFEVIQGARNALKSRTINFIQFEISAETMLTRGYLYDFWKELSPAYRFHLIMNQGLAEIVSYSAHLENFAGAGNFLCELKAT